MYTSQSLNNKKQKYIGPKTLLLFQHQQNHYKNIINPRKTVSYFNTKNEQSQKKRSLCSFLGSKFEKQRRAMIRQENKRIFKDCVEIEKGKGILQRAEEQYRTIKSQSTRKRSLVNQYKQKQQKEKIKDQNKCLIQKLYNLRPLVGEKSQWKKHQSFTKKLIQKISQSQDKNNNFSAQKILRYVIQKGNQNSQKKKNDGLEECLKYFKTLQLQNRVRQRQIDEKEKEDQKRKGKTCRQRKRKRVRKVKKEEINEERVQRMGNPEREQKDGVVEQSVTEEEEKLIGKLKDDKDDFQI